MPKHPDPTLNEVRALVYFFQRYLSRTRETVTLPNSDRVDLLIRESQQLVLSLIPDDDEDSPGMRLSPSADD